MKLQRFVPHLVAVVAATAPAAAQPIPAATPEGIFCTGTYIAVGRVLEAANAADSVVDLKVEIVEVIGAREASPSYAVARTPGRGDVIAISSPAFPRLQITAMPRPQRAALSDQQVRDAFVDKQFIFSLTVMDHHPTFRASLWPMSEKAWALDTMTNERGVNCPRRL